MRTFAAVLLSAALVACGTTLTTGGTTDGGDPNSLPPPAVPPSGAHLSLDCEAHGLRAYDATRSLLVGPSMRCTAHLSDRTGAPVRGAQVKFLIEAGRIQSDGVTSAAGEVDVLHEVAAPVPQDVAPERFTWTPLNDAEHTGELLVPTWMNPAQWVENPLSLGGSATPVFTLSEPRRPDPLRLKPDGSGRFENNPRDNLVTLIAAFDGEEGFTDTNGNGTWDPGEEFLDLTEPFVDMNDNGTFDSFEAFIDTNANRQWDGRNGKWDAKTKLWVMERFLWTGLPDDLDRQPVVAGVVGHVPVVQQLGATHLRCTSAGTLLCDQAQPERTGLFLADPWFNPLARLGPSDACAVRHPEILPVVVAVNDPPHARELWSAGEVLWVDVVDGRAAPSPRRVPPLEFSAELGCHYTAQPGAAPFDISLTLRGDVE